MYENLPAFILPLWVTGLSVVLFRDVERDAKEVRGGLLPRWRRLLIPIPAVIFLVANLDGIFSLMAYIDTHPFAVVARYRENQQWNTDRFFVVGIVASFILPFLVCGRFEIWAFLRDLAGILSLGVLRVGSSRLIQWCTASAMTEK